MGNPPCQPGGQAVQLLAVADQQTCAVLGQAAGVHGKTDEITALLPLLEPLDLTLDVVTALHIQRGHGGLLIGQKIAHYISEYTRRTLLPGEATLDRHQLIGHTYVASQS